MISHLLREDGTDPSQMAGWEKQSVSSSYLADEDLYSLKAFMYGDVWPRPGSSTPAMRAVGKGKFWQWEMNIRGFPDGFVCSIIKALHRNLPDSTPQDLVDDTHTEPGLIGEDIGAEHKLAHIPTTSRY